MAGVPDLGQPRNFSDPLFQRRRANADTLPARVYPNAFDSDSATQGLPRLGGG